MGGVSWDNLPIVLVSVIAQRVDCLNSLKNLSAVCKSWNSAVSKLILLPPKDPWLLLAEDAELDLSSVLVTKLEAIPCMVDDNNIENNVDDGHHDANDDGHKNNDIDHDNDDFQIVRVDRIITSIRDLFKNYSSIRGFYSLATQKIYYLDLPEAAGRLILGTNKGWLVTLGRDLEINLLHPLMRYQIPLPPMLTLPCQYEYDEDFPAQGIYTMFLTKVVMSSEVPKELYNPSTESEDTCNNNNLPPTIMAIHGEYRVLGFARLGDKLWKPIETCTRVFHDIVYHKGKFYSIDCHGAIFMCDIDYKREGRSKGIEITSIPKKKNDWVQSYLIQSLSGSHLWVVLRFRKGEYYRARFKPLTPEKLRYYTRGFLVFKLEIQICDDDDIPQCQWTPHVYDVGKEAFFLGLSSSTSVESSQFIKPNSIYFTDDETELFYRGGGGHDMGIFDIKTGTIAPHFSRTSIHPFAPSVWYI